MARIFILYKRADKEKVFPLKVRIEAAIGEPCWIDAEGIESDAQFADVIIRAIKAADVVLFMYSKHHAGITDYENDWTIREICYAKEEKKRIVFVNLDQSVFLDWFKFMFPQKQVVDATNPNAFTHLLRDLQTWLDVKVQEDTPQQMTESQHPNTPRTVRIYGYREWYLIHPDVKVSRNGKPIGKIAHDSYLDIECETDCDVLHFQYWFQSCRFVLYPSFTGSLQLVTNRFTGSISVEVV